MVLQTNEKPSPPTDGNPAGNADTQSLLGLSYSYPDDPLWRRLFTRFVEIASGQPFLVRLYLDYHATKTAGTNFFADILHLLKIDFVYDGEKLTHWPKTGPLVVVCNHPFGVVDGLGACLLAHRARGDFRILTNAVLDRAEEMRPFLLPVDFAGTRDALATNLASRAAALAYLKAGGCVVLFPSGAVSTTAKIWSRKVTDYPWKNFAAKLILEAQAAVALVFFEGANSRLFQIVSHISMTARMALFVHEIRRMIGRRVVARLGPVLPFSSLSGYDRAGLLKHLRHRLESLERT